MSLIKEGDKLPHIVFHTRVRDESIGGDNPFRWQDKTTEEIFGGKSVVLIGLPGAFTPTCSDNHLPGFEAAAADLYKTGVDEIICTSVNDAFVMFRWGKAIGVNEVQMLPDGNGEFAQAIGTLVSMEDIGFGKRSWRYSMYVVDGVVKRFFLEPHMADMSPEDPFEVSDAGTMADFLKGM